MRPPIWNLWPSVVRSSESLRRPSRMLPTLRYSECLSARMAAMCRWWQTFTSSLKRPWKRPNGWKRYASIQATTRIRRGSLSANTPTRATGGTGPYPGVFSSRRALQGTRHCDANRHEPRKPERSHHERYGDTPRWWKAPSSLRGSPAIAATTTSFFDEGEQPQGHDRGLPVARRVWPPRDPTGITRFILA